MSTPCTDEPVKSTGRWRVLAPFEFREFRLLIAAMSLFLFAEGMWTVVMALQVIALDNECVVCQNTRDSEGIAAGVDEDLYDHATEWRTWPGYSPQERVAAEFAARFAADHTGLRDDEDFWDRCNEQFEPELLTDLALSCAMWLGMGRMLRTLDIGQSCKITL